MPIHSGDGGGLGSGLGSGVGNLAGVFTFLFTGRSLGRRFLIVRTSVHHNGSRIRLNIFQMPTDGESKFSRVQMKRLLRRCFSMLEPSYWLIRW